MTTRIPSNSLVPRSIQTLYMYVLNNEEQQNQGVGEMKTKVACQKTQSKGGNRNVPVPNLDDLWRQTDVMCLFSNRNQIIQ